MNESKNPFAIIENKNPSDKVKDLKKTIKTDKKEETNMGNKEHKKG